MKQKKNINIIIGTNNAGKLREIKDLLPSYLKIYSPKEVLQTRTFFLSPIITFGGSTWNDFNHFTLKDNCEGFS